MNKDKKTVIGILAHVDAGKTTLSESLLFETKVIRKAGRVDNKDTFLDTDEVERQRGITIYSKNARIPLENRELIMIDTPGHVDFGAEMERSLSVLDSAILVVSATAGIQSHTKTLWRLLKAYNIPTFIFVNKMDMEGADEKKIFDELKKLSVNVISFTRYDDSFYENVATCSEKLTEKFLSGEEINDGEISEEIRNRNIYPVFFGSALKLTGVKEFVEGLDRFLPDVSFDRTGEFSGKVYKINRSRDGKRLTFIKVTGGSLKVKSFLGEEKINDLRLYSGEKYENAGEVFAGDICAVSGLMNTYNGQTFGKEAKGPSKVIVPALNYALKYPEDVDKNKMFGYMKELEDEDPTLSVEYRSETGEIFVSLMGEVQTEVLINTLQERYNVKASFTDGKICYRETVDDTAVGIGHFEPLRHYAEAQIKIEPGEPGSGIEYETDLSEDLLDKNWQRLILTHLMEKVHKGVVLGCPVTDVKFTLVAGRAHEKHTEGGDFRQATYRAVRQGLAMLKESGHVRILEPFYSFTLEIPKEYVGRAMTDITGMCGTCDIAENDFDEGLTILTGKAPVSTMKGYMREVTAYTKGMGKLSLVSDGYGPCHNEEEVVAASDYNFESDIRNSCDSVFCSHGAGVVIPWYEVPLWKHVEYSENGTKLVSDNNDYALEANRIRQERENSGQKDFISVTEVDSILRKSTHANENEKKAAAAGLSKAWAERRREQNTVKKEPKEVVYKGTPQKDKFILVDAYNVIHAWDKLEGLLNISTDAAAGALNDILCNYSAIKDIPIIAVYDAYRVAGHSTEIKKYNNITVVYTKEAQTADQYIERTAHEKASKFDITVVTSDGIEQVIVAGAGCNIISSRQFEEDVEKTTREFNGNFGVISQ